MRTHQETAWIILGMDPATDLPQLQSIAVAYGQSPTGAFTTLKSRLLSHIATLVPTDPSPYTAGAPTTPITPVPPVPAAATAPVTPVTPAPAVPAPGITPAPITGPGPAPAPGFIWNFQKPRFGAYRWVQIPDPALVPAALVPAAPVAARVDTQGFAILAAMIGIIALVGVLAFWAIKSINDDDDNDTPASTDNDATKAINALNARIDALGTDKSATDTKTTGSTDTKAESEISRETQAQTAAEIASAATSNVTAWNVPAPGSTDLGHASFSKKPIAIAEEGKWNHNVFNEDEFTEKNGWRGADSWFNTLLKGPASGGFWTSQGNSGEVIFRGTSNHIVWCLADLTTTSWNGIDLKKQFLSRGNPSLPAQVSVDVGHDTIVAVKTHSGEVKTAVTSDQGDVTIILPDNGITSICVDYVTAAPTHESFVKFGPYDRSENINTIDAR